MTRSVLRRRYIVKKGLQLRYIGLVFSLVALSCAVTGYTVFTTGWTLLGEKLANVYPQGRLLYVFRTTNMILLRNLLFISPFVFILALLFSHRIAGPLYRIEKSIYGIAKGNLALRLKLRKGDELGDLADIINTMTENFDKSIVFNKDALVKIRSDIEQIKNMIFTPSTDPGRLKGIIESLELKLKELDSSLNSWKTSNR